MEKRVLGKTGEKLSIIGFGGIVVSGMEQSNANNVVADAIDKDVNYFDVAPTYGDAEVKLGYALEGKRNNVFLACKAEERTKDGVMKQLEQSLKNLRTDYFDLYQMHSMTTQEDFDIAMGPNGALEALVEAKRKGLTRYIGFSAHSVEIALKLIDAFDFDTILFPTNWVNFFNADFGPQVVEKAAQKGMGYLAIKAMAMTPWTENEVRAYPNCWYKPVDDPELAALALRFTLSQPNVTAAIPPGDPNLFKLALSIGERPFEKITDEEVEFLKQRAKGLKSIFPQ
ncbi:aldo/keto reductase [Mahella australiensis]|jgi:aryl-alcohol dehydrogenase-like predicted oxidoreductase|uniref:Aldo/keto reductase n=1 Tax=Mahella australiensis (strain DSM 15567 / CIP 107919 / 50-1 BON) TaxID=697281 RepID=F4A1T4_MAHA5|nr:aldo/keto reductase [Mahella australiensis]AEE97134.1 aldo/keto reductase [Mahella australiensis 50-1 BON]MDI3508091.1 hypothetical protein [Clostridiales bacterium]